MKITNVQKRKGISPVIATVILIAITLIAAIAIAGFVFGLFGSFTSSAQVSVASVTIPSTGLVATGSCLTATATGCPIALSNSGTANTYATGSATITFGGKTYGLSVSGGATQGTCVGSTTQCPVNAGTTVTLYLYTAALTASIASGQQFVGSISTGNGASVSFSGTFS